MMKKEYTRLPSILTGFIFLLVLTLSHSSCNKDDECIPPVVDSLTFRDSNQQIDYVVPTRIMTLHGLHFKGSSTKIFINKSQLNPASIFITDTTIIFRMPSLTTNSSTENLSDSIMVVKVCGQDLLRINILLSPPYISKISNEYAVTGDTITIEGKFFNLLDSAIFPGSKEGEIVAEYTDSVCRIIVPEGATQQGELILTSASGRSSSAKGIIFRDRSGLLCNFDSLNTWGGWGGRVISHSTDPQIPEANGRFYAGQESGIMPGTDSVFQLILPLKSIPMPNYTGSLTADYFHLKFEIFSKTPWESGFYNIMLAKVNNEGAIEFSYEYNFQPWNDTIYNGTFITPVWETFNIPMSEFRLSSNGNLSIQSYSQIRAVNYMQWAFRNPSEEDGGQYINNFCVALDNIRIVQVKTE